MQVINRNLIIFMTLALIIMPLVTAELLKILGNHTKQQLVNHFGMNSQIVIGGLGVIIHELAHLITACIFFHHIRHFSLLEPRHYQDTGTLGYVEHFWNKGNLYQSLGNFFIGLAPCYVCSEVLWLIHGYLFNNQSLKLTTSPNVSNTIKISLQNVMHPFGNISWQLLIYLILIMMIASTGYGLSTADMHGTLSGLPCWIGFLVIIYIIVMLSNTSVGFTTFLWKLIILWLTFLGRGLIYIITSLVMIKGLAKIKENINRH